MFKLSVLFISFVFLVRNAIGVHFTDDSLITDVCGISKFNDKYHMFYQYFNLTENGERDINFFQKVSWGHSTSTDLLKWTIHDKIINPTIDPQPTFFKNKEVKHVSPVVPFSGSTIVDSTNATGLLVNADEPILMLYTSLSKFLFDIQDPETYGNFIFSTVHMFYSYDGYKFERYHRPMIEKSETLRNFRDPVVFKYKEGHYNLIMEENTKLGIHKSSDLINWTKVSTFEYEVGSDVVEWETPNVIRVGNKTLLVLSVNLKPDDSYWHWSTVKYFVGDFDGYRFSVERNQSREFDGPDLYAISINDEHIMMGMLNNWKYISSVTFNGTLTYPRKIGKLEVKNMTYLTQQFINLDAFGEQLFESKDVVNDKMTYNFVINKAHYLKIKLTNLNCTKQCDFELKFSDTENTVLLGYNYSTNDFYLDRNESKKVNVFFNDVHRYKPKYKKILDVNHFEIDLILDVNSVELLTDQGMVAVSALHLNDKIFKTFTLTTNQNYKINELTISHYF